MRLYLWTLHIKIKIVDFGFAEPRSVSEHKYKGTLDYMAPEIHEKVPYYGHVADTFALGVILFNMYTKSAPFQEANPRTDYNYSLLSQGLTYQFWK